MVAPATGLQLDLLTIIGRLEQIRDECVDDGGELTLLGHTLLFDRVIGCDVRRLRGYLTEETLAWENEMNEELDRQREAQAARRRGHA